MYSQHTVTVICSETVFNTRGGGGRGGGEEGEEEGGGGEGGGEEGGGGEGQKKIYTYINLISVYLYQLDTNTLYRHYSGYSTLLKKPGSTPSC